MQVIHNHLTVRLLKLVGLVATLFGVITALSTPTPMAGIPFFVALICLFPAVIMESSP
jgi:hypothetical protein